MTSWKPYADGTEWSTKNGADPPEGVGPIRELGATVEDNGHAYFACAANYLIKANAETTMGSTSAPSLAGTPFASGQLMLEAISFPD
ncbi:hypothetical protein PV773_24255 [Mesorhizobium sp. CC13]|uniref:hypothetical protein n=1 Tax=Mesorhizobium sp. CC13 TaxID=3029194 RepID=UPI003263BF77